MSCVFHLGGNRYMVSKTLYTIDITYLLLLRQSLMMALYIAAHLIKDARDYMILELVASSNHGCRTLKFWSTKQRMYTRLTACFISSTPLFTAARQYTASHPQRSGQLTKQVLKRPGKSCMHFVAIWISFKSTIT